MTRLVLNSTIWCLRQSILLSCVVSQLIQMLTSILTRSLMHILLLHQVSLFSFTFYQHTLAPILTFPIIKSRRLGLQWTKLPDNFVYYLDMRPIPVGYENNLPMRLTDNEVLVTGMEPETPYYFMIKAKSSDNVLTTDEFVISQATGKPSSAVKTIILNHSFF